jgi:hypothetical protein
MTNIFSALSGGLTKFLYAWILPSAITVTVFLALVLPYVPGGPSRATLLETPPLAASLVLVLGILGLSVVFAYASLPVYRFLEGYTMPDWWRRRLTRRRTREWHRLRHRFELTAGTATNWELTLEALEQYPDSAEAIQATKLGNAMVAMEIYGNRAYGLDSQTLWYELQSVVTESVRRDVEDARAAVDFFVSAIAHLTLLTAVASVVALWSYSLVPAVVAVAAACLVPAAYRQAVLNVAGWRGSMRALVNLGRVPLADALGLRLPRTFESERAMWESFVDFVHYGPEPEYLKVLNPSRKR